MCAPEIIRQLGDLDSTGTRRRAFFRAAAATVAVAVAAPAATARATSGGVLDLTHVLSPQTPVWPGNPPFSAVPVAWEGLGGFNQNMLALWEHTGTHVDAPAHRRGSVTTDMLPAQDLVAPLVVIDIRDRASADPDAGVTVADLTGWEKRHGRIPDRAFVAMYSGWEQRLAVPGAFVALDEHGIPHGPGFTAEAAEFLVSRREIVGAGVDTLSLDRAADRDYGAHNAFLGSGRYGVEMLANLGSAPPVGATIVVGAPKHAGGTGGPCRVLALT